MAETSFIEWTDATWNPVTGCSVVSPGCTNCYAMKLAGTRLKHHPSRAGLTIDTKAGPVWTGEVRLNDEWLLQPLSWRRPRKIFVCAHGDLFHESVPDAWIDQVFAVMALAPQHVFQMLTKRAERMRDYLTAARLAARILNAMDRVWPRGSGNFPDWPLPNVWLGVSAEDQARADARIPHLLATPAAVRFVSAEPLLGPINIIDAMWASGAPADNLDSELDWLIAGGESGPSARPMHPYWARFLRDQCAAAGVPFFFKQWGAWAPLTAARPVIDGLPVTAWPNGTIGHGNAKDHGGPGTALFRGTKKIAGRLLDGVTHDGMPEATHV